MTTYFRNFIKAIMEISKEININNLLLRKSIEKQAEVVRRLDSLIQSQAGYQAAITDFMKFREDVEKEEIKKIAAEKIDREPTEHDLVF